MTQMCEPYGIISLDSSVFWPWAGFDPQEVTAEEWTKVGCLLSNYPSGCITSLFCPLRPAASGLGYYRIPCGFIDPTPIL